MRDPMMDFLCEASMTWHSAFIVTRSGKTCAIVGQMEKQTIDDMGVYHRVLGYIEGIKGHFLETLKEINPSSIAVNYSEGSEVCDGLTHGMYLTLQRMLREIGFEGRIVPAEKIASRLKARKTASEIARMRTAVDHTLDIFSLVTGFIRPGRTEREIADFMVGEAEKRGLELGWDPSHCPAVFTGPETAGAHYKPTDRKVERGHVLNMDFGVKFQGYTSDLQRTFYVLAEGEKQAPPQVVKGFDTIVTSIEMARQALKPGVKGVEVDRIAREYIVSRGYDEYPMLSATRWGGLPMMGQPFWVHPGKSMQANPSNPSKRGWSLPSSRGSRFPAAES